MRERRNQGKMNELRRRADYVCRLILNTDYPDVDIEIERANLRARCEKLFPDRMHLYDLVYESRFDRLWRQWREPEKQEGEVSTFD